MPQVVKPVQTLDGYLTRQAWRWLGPLAVVSVVLLGWSVREEHQQQTGRLSALTTSVRQAVEEDLTRRVQGLQALAGGILRSHVRPSLADWHSHAQGYEATFGTAVSMADAQRVIRFNTRVPLGTELPPLPRPKGTSAFDEAMATGQPRFGNVTFGPVVRKTIVTVIVPVRAESQPMALLALVPVENYQAMLMDETLPQGWRLTLIDPAGQVIAGTHQKAGALAEPASGAIRRVETTRLAGWTVAVEAEPWAFYRPHLQVGGGLLLGLALAFGGAAVAARKSRNGLVTATAQLMPGRQAAPAPGSGHEGDAVPRIAEIEAAHDELARAALARRVAEDAERDRIARDLHDGLQQQAAAVKLHLDMALAQLPAQGPGAELVGVARHEVDRLIRTVDDTVHNLRPSPLALLGLSGALGELVDQVGVVGRVQGELEVLGGDAADALPATVAECLYRVVQECLNNVRKHARASFVHIVLDASDPGQVTLTVSDDGVGIDSDRRLAGPGMGLSEMARRVALLDGALDIRRGQVGDADQGTTVEVRLPLRGAGIGIA